MKQRARVAVATLALMSSLVPQAWAWGREGHRITALVAENYLSPETKAQIAELLRADNKSRESLADIASWADSYREERPETAGWHYVDIPADQAKFDRQRDCPVSTVAPKSPWRDCVTDRILYFEGRLGDTSLAPKERAIALKFLVHLLGDIHQPFHALGDARGGNEISVSFLGSSICDTNRCNLHGVWDDAMIRERNLSEPKYVAMLEQQIAENHWERLSGGEPTTWANISHKYAVDALVPTGAVVSREYYEEESKIMNAQLALGGLRLARVLNRILGAPPVAAPAEPTATQPAPSPK